MLEGRKRDDYRLACLIRHAVWAEKKMPSYEELFRQAEDMSDDDLYSRVRILNRLLGGTET